MVGYNLDAGRRNQAFLFTINNVKSNISIGQPFLHITDLLAVSAKYGHRILRSPASDRPDEINDGVALHQMASLIKEHGLRPFSRGEHLGRRDVVLVLLLCVSAREPGCQLGDL